jgi:hypothetical protein
MPAIYDASGANLKDLPALTCMTAALIFHLYDACEVICKMPLARVRIVILRDFHTFPSVSQPEDFHLATPVTANDTSREQTLPSIHKRLVTTEKFSLFWLDDAA